LEVPEDIDDKAERTGKVKERAEEVPEDNKEDISVLFYIKHLFLLVYSQCNRNLVKKPESIENIKIKDVVKKKIISKISLK
jgi:hypothetical protein